MALCIYLSSLVSTMTPVYLWEVLTLDITRGPRPLIDHLTTVSAYFNDHKSQANQKIQDDYFRKFTCYLLPTCWLKDVKRIGSWQAMVASTNCGKDSTISIAMMKANLRITLPATAQRLTYNIPSTRGISHFVRYYYPLPWLRHLPVFP